MGLLAILAQPCAECTDTKSGSGILISNKEVGLRSRACPRSPGALQPRASSAGEAHRRQASDRCIRREASGPAPKQAAYAARPGRICRARVQGPAGICAATGPAPDKRGFCLPRRSERSASEVLPPFRRDGTGGVRRCAWWPGWALRLAVRPRCSTVQGGSLCDVTVRPRMLVLGAGSKPRGGGGQPSLLLSRRRDSLEPEPKGSCQNRCRDFSASEDGVGKAPCLVFRIDPYACSCQRETLYSGAPASHVDSPLYIWS